MAKELKLAGAVEASAKDGSDTIDDAFFITAVNAIDIKEGEAIRSSSQMRVDTEGSQQSAAQSNGHLSSATRTTRSQRGFDN